MQLIFLIIIFLLVFVVIVIMVAATYVFRLVRKVKKFVHGEPDDAAGATGGFDFTGRRQQQYSNENWNRANGNRKRSSRERIVDSRDPEIANRRIIEDNVGEYVDFEETK